MLFYYGLRFIIKYCGHYLNFRSEFMVKLKMKHIIGVIVSIIISMTVLLILTDNTVSAVPVYGDSTTDGIGSELLSRVDADGSNLKTENSGYFYVQTVEDGTCYIVGVRKEHRADTSITVPASVVASDGRTYSVIGLKGGRYYGHFTAVTVEKGMKTGGCYVFSGMSNLETVTFNTDSNFKYMTSYTAVYQSMFAGTKVKNITLPNSLVEIGVVANSMSSNDTGIFTNSLIEHVTFEPTSVCTLGSGVFKSCTNLKGFNLASKIRLNGSYIFYGTDLSEGVTIANDCVTMTIGDYTFAKTSLSNFEARGNIKTIGNRVFENSRLCVLDLRGSNVESIGSYLCSGSAIEEFYAGDSLKTINDNAFRDCTKLVIADLGLNTEIINDQAFRGCTNLATVVVSSKLKTIGTETFYGVKLLHSFDFPEGLLEIKSYAFWGSGLENIVLPESLKTIGYNAFGINNELRHLTIKNYVDINSNAFVSCSKLVDVDISCLNSDITSMGGSVFKGCSALESINLHNIKNIGVSFCESCSSLNTITGLDLLVEIPDSAFANCTSLRQVNLPDTIEVIDNKAFYHCPISEINIKNVRTLGDSCFESTKFNSIDLPNTLETIGAYAFRGTPISGAVYIPASVTSIGDYAFLDTPKIESMIFNSGSNLTVIPTGFIKQLNDCALNTLVLPENCVSISNSAFLNCNKLEDFTFPITLERIGQKAFSGTSSLRNMKLPNDVTVIDAYAFQNSGIMYFGITSKSKLTTIGDYAFNACTNLQNILIPAGVTTLGQGAFSDCTLLKNVDFRGETLTTIPKKCFTNCSVLPEIVLPNDTQIISDEAFKGCTTLKELNFEDLTSLTTIGTSTFENTGLEYVFIPSNVNSIGSKAFLNISGLKELKFANDSVLQVIPINFVSDARTWVADIYLPNSITSINSDAFGSLHSATFADNTNLHTVGTEIFYEGADYIYNFPATVNKISKLVSYSYRYSNGTICDDPNTYSREIKGLTFSNNSIVTELWDTGMRIGEYIEFPDSLRYWYTATPYWGSYFNGNSVDFKNIEYVGYYESTKSWSELIRYPSYMNSALFINRDAITMPKMKFFSALGSIGPDVLMYKDLAPELQYLNSGYSILEPDLTTYLSDELIVVCGTGTEATKQSTNIVTLPDCEEWIYAYTEASLDDSPQAMIKIGKNLKKISGAVQRNYNNSSNNSDAYNVRGLSNNGSVKLIIDPENTQFTISDSISTNAVNGCSGVNISDIFKCIPNAYRMNTGVNPLLKIHIYAKTQDKYNQYLTEYNSFGGCTFANYNTKQGYLYAFTQVHNTMTDLDASLEDTSDGVMMTVDINNDTDLIKGVIKITKVSGDSETLIKTVPTTLKSTKIKINDSDIEGGTTTYKVSFVSNYPILDDATTSVSYDKNALGTVIDVSDTVTSESVTITGNLTTRDTTSIKDIVGLLSIYKVEADGTENFIKSASENEKTITLTMDRNSPYLKCGVNNYIIRYVSSDTNTFKNCYEPVSISFDGMDAQLSGSADAQQGGMSVTASIEADALDHGELSIFLGDNNLAEKINSNNGLTAYISPKKLKKGTNYITLVYETDSAYYYSDKKVIQFEYDPIDTTLALDLSMNSTGTELSIIGSVTNEDLSQFVGTLNLYSGDSELGTLLKSVTTTTLSTTIPRSLLTFGGNNFTLEWIPSNTYTSYTTMSNIFTLAGRDVELIGGVTNLGDNISITAKALSEGVTLNPANIKVYIGASEFGVPCDMGVTEDLQKAITIIDKHKLNVGMNNFYVVYEPIDSQYSEKSITLTFSMAADGSESIPTDPGVKPEDLYKIVEAIVDLHNAFDVDILKLITCLNENFDLISGDLTSIKDALLTLSNSQVDYSTKFDNIVDAIKAISIQSGGSGSNEEIKDLLELIKSMLENNNSDEYYQQVVEALQSLEVLNDISDKIENLKEGLENNTVAIESVADILKEINSTLEKNNNQSFDTSGIEKALVDLVSVMKNLIANSVSNIDTDVIESELGNISNTLGSINNTLGGLGGISNSVNDFNHTIENGFNMIGGKLDALGDQTVTVDTWGIENAINQLVNGTDKTDATQAIVDAINNIDVSGGNADFSAIEDLLRNLVESEKDKGNITIDLSSIESVLRELIGSYPRDQISDLSGIEYQLQELRKAMADNKSDVDNMCDAIYALITEMRNSNMGSHDSGNGFNDSELITALNRIGTMISNSSDGMSKETANGILAALKSLNDNIEKHSITSEDIQGIIKAIDNLKIPDNSESDKLLAESLNTLADSITELKNFKGKDNSLTSAFIIGLFILVGTLSGSFVIRGGILKGFKMFKENEEDDQNTRR